MTKTVLQYYRNIALYTIMLLNIIFFVGCTTKEHYIVDSKPKKNTISSGSSSSKSMTVATMRPYEVGGKVYTPTVVSIGELEEGMASWYGTDFHGRKTSNGEIYDMYALTAAHKTLPMNTLVKVTHRNTQQSVTVRINDRGPFVAGRIIDLSMTAGKVLGLDKTGIAPVKLEVVGFDNQLLSRGQTRTVNLFSVQIGAFKEKVNADNLTKSSQGWMYQSESKYAQGFYRVFLKGFKSEDEAKDFIKQGHFKGAFIVAE